MPSQQQWLIGVSVLALTIIIVFLFILKRRSGPKCKKVVRSLASATAAPQPPQNVVVNELPPASTMAEMEPEPLPPIPPAADAPSQQTVESHRAELLRGTALARARVSAPTTSALIMNSALSGRDSHRQNIGETAIMDRLNSAASQEAAPW
jgi:hypothetical protein